MLGLLLPTAQKFFVQPRLTAFIVHLGVSILFFLLLLGILYVFWFPQVLFIVSGGWEGLRIVAFVDIVLGPLLTLIIYDIAKPRIELARDIGIIATLQLICLFAGAYTVYQGRPIAIIHEFDTFHVMRTSDFEEFKLDPQSLDAFAGSPYKLLYVQSEDNAVAQLSANILDGLNGYRPKYLQPKRYQAMPSTKVERRSILSAEDAQNDPACIVQNITSVFKQGTVCFNPDTLSFSQFSRDKSISALDDITVDINPGDQP